MTVPEDLGDWWELCAGDFLDEGVHRHTYACAFHSGLVIKVEQNKGQFANVKEWDFWQEWQFCHPVANWLAPCVAISPNGKFLLQRKTRPLKMSQLPKELPRFLTDRKLANYGLLGNRVMCHDYAATIKTVRWDLTRARFRDA